MPPRNFPGPRPQEDDVDHDIVIESNWGQISDDFEKMGLKKTLRRGIYAYGLEKPAPVQQRAIVPMIRGRDLIMQAQSGTGKTAAFVIAILQRLNLSVHEPQALILAPTRELAVQIQKVIVAIGQYMAVKSYVCIGGRNVRHDIQELGKGVHIVVGTSGRVHDVIKRGALKPEKISILCIDEADEMLSRRGKSEIKKVLELLSPKDKQVVPKDKQVIFLSATIPADKLRDMTKDMMRDPIKILVKKEQLTLEGIQQFFISMEKEDWKLDTLCDLYTNDTFTHPTVVFRNSRKKVDQLSAMLEERELSALVTHGRKSQKDREERLQGFRTGSSRVLVTTDMLSRGIDVQQIAVVINYDLPKEKEVYMHRIGRSGRFGRKGIAINFVMKGDIGMLRQIEEYYSTQIEEMPLDISTLLKRMSLGD